MSAGGIGIDEVLSPNCGKRMELRSELELPPATRRILAGLAAASGTPP